MLPWFEWTSFPIGPLTIQVWGMWVALGMAISLLLVSKYTKNSSWKVQQIVDLASWMIIGGLIGARVFHIVFYEASFYIAYPIEIVKIWKGGLSSFGGIFGAVLPFMLFIKKHRFSKEKVFALLDILSMSALYGWLVGRIGCACIHDHLGIPCNSNCFLALDTPEGPRYDMAVLEIICLLPLAIWFAIAKKKGRKAGWFFRVLIIYYGILRFFLDFMRARDIQYADARYGGLTPAQYFGIILVLFGLYLHIRREKSK